MSKYDVLGIDFYSDKCYNSSVYILRKAPPAIHIITTKDIFVDDDSKNIVKYLIFNITKDYFMNNLTHYAYYGEYTIGSWIDFILNGEIKLPDYQRNFVWNVKQASNLIDAILEGRFISPLTIVSTKYDLGEMKSGLYLLDGQQRISSILLFCLGKWINEDYQEEKSDDEEYSYDFVPWTFKKLQDLYKSCNDKEELKKKMSEDKRSEDKRSEDKRKAEYCDLDNVKKDKYITQKDINEVSRIYKKLQSNKNEFLSKKLGYSFIKSIGDEEVERKLYANLFREINSSGVKLSPSESRTAMYYIVPKLKDLFEPDFLKTYKIAKDGVIDLTRYLAYVFRWYEQNKNGDYYIDKIARGYSAKLEDYVLEYVSEVTENYQSNKAIYDKQTKQVEQFEKTFKELFSPSEISTWEISDVEWNLFGLIYCIIFDNKKIDVSKKDTLIAKLKNKKPQTEKKKVGAIRVRLQESVKIYKEYLQEEDSNG